jgi:hypothetical protein
MQQLEKDRFSLRVLVNSIYVGRHSQSLANINQQLWTICWNTYTLPSRSLSLYIFIGTKKYFEQTLQRKVAQMFMYPIHIFFVKFRLLRDNKNHVYDM